MPPYLRVLPKFAVVWFSTLLAVSLLLSSCSRKREHAESHGTAEPVHSAAKNPTTGVQVGAPQRAASEPAETGGSPKLSEVRLRIAASDAPAWLAWSIAQKKSWFAEAGLQVELEYYDYVPSLEAFAAGKADAVAMTNRDQLLMASTGVESIAILVNATSFGNDVLVARKGIGDVGALRGKKVGVELGFSSHSLVLHALAQAEMSSEDVQLVNVASQLGPRNLQRRDVDAIATREPFASRALQTVAGSQAIFTTRKAPGLFYQLLCVRPNHLEEERAAWSGLMPVWQRVVDFVTNEETRPEAIALMAERAGVSENTMSKLVNGTRFEGLEANRRHFRPGTTLDSLLYSTTVANAFHVEQGLQSKRLDVERLLDSSLVESR